MNSPIPSPCVPLASRVDVLRERIDLLREALRTEGEPDVQAAIRARLNALGLELGAVRNRLRQCVIDNGPPPPPTTPTLSVHRIEGVQTIQTIFNNVVVTDGPAIVRAYVESGITNHFDSGAGPNRWAGIKGVLTLRDMATGSSSVSTNHIPASIVARPAPEAAAGQNPAHTLNFLVTIPANVTDLSLVQLVRIAYPK